ncbi:hypothetical protein P378_08910 [Desulforamulus profundi]|uniref:Helix-turn-helix conjugative transposon-like domain-containing protein n=1 Tax=Desulforamulus profundi TaxID=1383067 RepID=A0A2C6MG28_9FIRM|nr:helix-turn-helix domain-containing protein [Desulforamulus profundi]PHJ38645.1 hypothetical protein P378_08910 [Desulforamulus profundi]
MPEILDLIEAAQHGNERAMETLIRQFEPLIIKNLACLASWTRIAASI